MHEHFKNLLAEKDSFLDLSISQLLKLLLQILEDLSALNHSFSKVLNWPPILYGKGGRMILSWSIRKCWSFWFPGFPFWPDFSFILFKCIPTIPPANMRRNTWFFLTAFRVRLIFISHKSGTDGLSYLTNLRSSFIFWLVSFMRTA